MKKIVRKRQLFNNKLVLNILLVLFMFLTIGYSTLSTNLNILGNLNVKKYYEPTLYNVLAKEAETGGLAREYTGNHQDSMDPSLSTEKIYHWYASNNNQGDEIQNKNNVLFAGQCFQMIRTTDTGGVRLLYNGEPTLTGSGDNISYDCSPSRPGHIGTIKSTKNISGNYYYGDGYTTSTSNNTTTYTLTNPIQITVNSTDPATTISTIASNNPYTCISDSTSCTTLYKVDSQSSGTTAYVYQSTYRDAIGTGPFNNNGNQNNAIGDVGYMYNARYTSEYRDISTSYNVYSKISFDESNINKYKTYYFADSYTMSGDSHTLTNPVKGETIADYPLSWVGKYYCASTSLTTCINMHYFAGADESEEYIQLYTAALESGKQHDDQDYKYLFGDSITDNGDGTIEISGNVQEIIKNDWINEYQTKTNKFICMPGYYTYDSINNKYICSDNGTQGARALRYITATTGSNFTANTVNKYGYGITPDGNSYKLVGYNSEDGTLQYIYDWLSTTDTNCFTNQGDTISNCGYKSITKSHYTCYNLSGNCSTYYYINFTHTKGSVYAISISDGKYFSTDLTDHNNIIYISLLQNDQNGNVNVYDSNVKKIIDNWYFNTLLTNYDTYIEDTIYCNNRGIKDFGSFNPYGSETHENAYLYLKEHTSSKDLSCEYITDRFSTSNNSAHLTYKTALISQSEMKLLNNSKAQKGAFHYWILASGYYRYFAYGRAIDSLGIGRDEFYTSNHSIRPAISLISGIRYTDGDGSVTNPYIVDTN